MSKSSYSESHGGLMVGTLDSGSSSPGSSPGQGHCVVFLVPLSTQEYKWVTGKLLGQPNKMLGGNLALD